MATALLCGAVMTSAAAAKTPGTTYCFLGVCHRVLTLAETEREIGLPTEMVASYYDTPERDRFNPSLVTSSGEIFRAGDDDTAASPIYPDGTSVLVYEPRSGGAAVLRINNAGPYFSNRLIDLSRGAAERLGIDRRGVARVEVMILSAPQPQEARYVLGRIYAPLPGFIGRFDSLRAAHEALKSGPQAALAAIPPAEGRRADIPVPPSRIVIIPGGSRAGAVASLRGRRGTRVVLLPVRQRRPQLLTALSQQRLAKVRKTASQR